MKEKITEQDWKNTSCLIRSTEWKMFFLASSSFSMKESQNFINAWIFQYFYFNYSFHFRCLRGVSIMYDCEESLEVRRNLLNPNFEGYKLSLDALPKYHCKLPTGKYGSSINTTLNHQQVSQEVDIYHIKVLTGWWGKEKGASYDAGLNTCDLGR